MSPDYSSAINPCNRNNAVLSGHEKTQPDLLGTMQSGQYNDLSIGGVQSRCTTGWLWPIHLQPNIGIWPILWHKAALLSYHRAAFIVN
jgi:hypothetical protein